MLSPTFREERLLEKREESTEKEQAKDLVSEICSQYTNAYSHTDSQLAESQSPRPRRQDPPPEHKLRLLLHCPLHAQHDFFNLQRYKGPPCPEQPPTLGAGDKDLAADDPPRYCLHLAASVCYCALAIPQGQSEEGGEGGDIL